MGGVLRLGGTVEPGTIIQQDFALAHPGPRDPTACWKLFPTGNQGRSSSLSRAGKLEKANGLAWSAVGE